MIKKLFYLFVIYCITISSCDKGEFTIPVSVDLNVSILSESQHDYLQFTSGEIAVKDIIFQGEREAGEDVYFTSQPSQVYGPVEFTTFSNSAHLTHFDIPQGNYELMEWEFNLSFVSLYIDEDSDDSDEEEDDEEDDEEEEEESIELGLVFKGTYTTEENVLIPIIIGIDVIENFRILAEYTDGTHMVNLIETNTYKATLSFDLQTVFQSISRESLEDADINDKNELVINSEENEDIYELILYRLEKTSKVIFEEK